LNRDSGENPHFPAPAGPFFASSNSLFRKAFPRRFRIDTASQPFVYLSSALSRRRNQKGMTMTKFIKLIRNSKGATAIEYGLIAALIAVAAIAAMQSVGSKLGDTFNNVSDEL
jgi:pilus assembly protein Flp/PilA